MAGAGAVGCWLGARLAAAGHHVELWGRPALQDAVARDGLRVSGATTFRGRLPVHVTPPDRTFDAVFLTTKAHATLDAAADVARLAGGVVASLQNGIGNGERIAASAGVDRVAVCLTSHGLTAEAPGVVWHAGTGATTVGCLEGADPAAARAAMALLSDAGLDPAWTDNTRGAVWTKAAVNAAINPLGALHNIPNGEVLRDHWPQVRELAGEVYSLSRAAGVRLTADPVAATRATLERTAQNRCSMLQDITARRPTEIDQITGHFVRVARRLGYPLFANEDIYRRLKALEATYLDEAYLLRRAREEAEWLL